MADFFISTDGVNITATARPDSGFISFTDTDASAVIQYAIDSLTGIDNDTGGGRIEIATGDYYLTNAVVITGWDTSDPPRRQIQICGSSYSTNLLQLNNNHGIVVKNKASIALRDFHIYVADVGKNGILFDDNGLDSEISVFGCSIDNILIASDSETHAAFHAKNFFDIQATHLSVHNPSNDGLWLEGTGTSLNYGNSNFSFLRVYASNDAPYAALKITSVNQWKPINMLNFCNAEGVGGYYGIYLYGACYNTFQQIDFEYMKYPVYVTGTTGLESSGNSFNGGYVFAMGEDSCCITCTPAANENVFALYLQVEEENVNTFNADLIIDTQTWSANAYNVGLSYPANPAKIYITDVDNTQISYRHWTGAVCRVPKPPVNDNSNISATTAFVQDAIANSLLARSSGKSINNILEGEQEISSLSQILPANSGVTFTMGIPEAIIGDAVAVGTNIHEVAGSKSTSASLDDLMIHARVSAEGQVAVRLYNPTSSDLPIPIFTCKIRVIK